MQKKLNTISRITEFVPLLIWTAISINTLVLIEQYDYQLDRTHIVNFVLLIIASASLISNRGTLWIPLCCAFIGMFGKANMTVYLIEMRFSGLSFNPCFTLLLISMAVTAGFRYYAKNRTD